MTSKKNPTDFSRGSVNIIKYIGIDGGKNGGMAVLDEEQRLLEFTAMPLTDSSKGKTYDLMEIEKFIEKHNPAIVMFEEAHPMFRDGVKRSFVTGQLYGMMTALLTVKRISFEIVRASVWQKDIFNGQTVKDTKSASIEFCKRKYPDEDFTATERSRKLHDGITDAICIALYNYRKNRK